MVSRPENVGVPYADKVGVEWKTTARLDQSASSLGPCHHRDRLDRASFYFVFLIPASTRRDEDLNAPGVGGELWAVHGGGFYHPAEVRVIAARLPDHLHWFYWESYSTWLTGFALFTISYLWNASTYLIDRR